MSSDHPFTTGQAAEFCHVSQATIVNWIKARKLNGYTTPGGHYRIPRADLISFLESHDMPVDAALERADRSALLVLSNQPEVRQLATQLGETESIEIRVASTEYAAGAEAVRSRPDAVVVDVRASSDPLGFCQWLRKTIEGVGLVIVGDGDAEATAKAVHADTWLSFDALEQLEEELEELLQ